MIYVINDTNKHYVFFKDNSIYIIYLLFIYIYLGLQPPNQNQQLWSDSAELSYSGHRWTVLGAEANIQVHEY